MGATPTRSVGVLIRPMGRTPTAAVGVAPPPSEPLRHPNRDL